MIELLRSLDRKMINLDLLIKLNDEVGKSLNWDAGNFSIFLAIFADQSTALMIDLPTHIKMLDQILMVVDQILMVVDQMLPFE